MEKCEAVGILYGLIADVNAEEIADHIKTESLQDWSDTWRCRAKEMLMVLEDEPSNSEKPNNYCDDCLYTDTCDSKEFFYACTSKATISKMEQVDKDINVRSKGEPQTDNPCDGCVCDDGKHLMYCMNCKGIAWKTEPPKVEDEPQTDCAWR